MTLNMLAILRDAGSELMLSEQVLDEVVSRLRATDLEFRNYFQDVKPYVTRELARHANKILIRAYFYARLSPIFCEVAPAGWRSFIGQICTYNDLHRPQGREQIRMCLIEKFKMTFRSAAEMAAVCDEDEGRELAAKILPVKKEEILALNDAKQILAIYAERKAGREDARANPYGLRHGG